MCKCRPVFNSITAVRPLKITVKDNGSDTYKKHTLTWFCFCRAITCFFTTFHFIYSFMCVLLTFYPLSLPRCSCEVKHGCFLSNHGSNGGLVPSRDHLFLQQHEFKQKGSKKYLYTLSTGSITGK